MNQWMLLIEDRLTGPCSDEDLRQLARDERIRPGTPVRRVGERVFRPAQRINGLTFGVYGELGILRGGSLWLDGDGPVISAPSTDALPLPVALVLNTTDPTDVVTQHPLAAAIAWLAKDWIAVVLRALEVPEASWLMYQTPKHRAWIVGLGLLAWVLLLTWLLVMIVW